MLRQQASYFYQGLDCFGDDLQNFSSSLFIFCTYFYDLLLHVIEIRAVPRAYDIPASRYIRVKASP